jgi:antitoxin component of MazEF toxin-antitoxin module
MKKIVKRWGNSLVIVFTKEDTESYGLVEGDVIDIDDMLIQNRKKKK